MTTDPAQSRTLLERLARQLKQRMQVQRADSLDYFRSALRELEETRGLANASLRLSCFLDCGMYFYTSGLHEDCVRAGRDMIQLASRVGDQQGLRKAHLITGIGLADSGHIGEALQHYAESGALARSLGDQIGEQAVLCNVAVAFNYAGLYRESLAYSEKAIEISRRVDSPVRIARSLSNAAQSHLYLGEHERGFDAISKCLSYLPQPGDSWDALGAAVCEFTFVQLALEIGEVASALEHRDHCVRYCHWNDTMRAQFLAQVTIGLCEIHTGSADTGLKRLEDALARCGDVGQFRSDALIALTKAYDRVGRTEDALRSIRALMQHLHALRASAMASTAQWRVSDVADNVDLGAFQASYARLESKAEHEARISAQIETLERLAMAADLREESSGAHGHRVGALSALLAEQLGWSKAAAEALRHAAKVHDLGKTAVPERILFSSAALQSAERELIASHTTIGAELLAGSRIPHLQLAESIARHHHEWWDGTGYPAKLAGKRIPIHARIVALADVFDALTHGRPFSPPWPMDKALDEIKSRRGTQFDPELTDVFLTLVAKLRVEHEDLDAFLGAGSRDSPFLQARAKIRHMLEERVAPDAAHPAAAAVAN